MPDDRENKHMKIKRGLQIGGAALLGVGILCVIIAFIDFFGSIAGNDMSMPTKFWLFFIGFPCIAGGAGMLMFGSKREIARYIKNESMPVINEFSTDIRYAVKNVAGAVREGITGETEDIACPSCGTKNDHDSKYCKHCSKAVQKHCASCGIQSDGDAKFCKNCGNTLK